MIEKSEDKERNRKLKERATEQGICIIEFAEMLPNTPEGKTMRFKRRNSEIGKITNYWAEIIQGYAWERNNIMNLQMIEAKQLAVIFTTSNNKLQLN